MLRAFAYFIAALAFFAAFMIFLVFGHGQYVVGWLLCGVLCIFFLVLAWRSFQQRNEKQR